MSSATANPTTAGDLPADYLPADYLERVYAGVLGKLIGVYLGRPFEGWSYERITAELGEVDYYVHKRFSMPLVVTDDDISGTFTFVRALEDYGYRGDLTSAQIGQSWLNYILEGRTILWWGGLGMSTEHTAFLRLKEGVSAPESGSAARNGKRVAEQIGAQIFIDGWGLIAPGAPALAADFAERAGRVSHDGEAVYAAQVVAALEAQAFIEQDIPNLLDTALALIPDTSVIAKVIRDLRAFYERDKDWRHARAFVADTYGYDKYKGVCHVVPNHALIILALLYGEGDFQKSLLIVNTCGWDTDCNSGNVGCILGVRNGLAGMTQADWRGPVADRLYLPTADGGRAITDAVTETYHLVNAARRLRKLDTLAPKDGARFHFELPGSTQGFLADTPNTLTITNVGGHSASGERSLALRYQLPPGEAARVYTATFSPLEALALTGKAAYDMVASPTLYPGQQLRASLKAAQHNGGEMLVRLYLSHYNGEDALTRLYGPESRVSPGCTERLSWRIPEVDGQPIAEVGFELAALTEGAADGCIFLDYLGWEGAPEVVFAKPKAGGSVWRQAWVNGVDILETRWEEPYRLIQNSGRGLTSQGTREWVNYRVEVPTTPHLSKASGVAVCVQGMRRYYALLLCEGHKVRLVKALDGDTVLAETDFIWEYDVSYTLALETRGGKLRAFVNSEQVFDLEDVEHPLMGGAVALVCEEGMLTCETVTVKPV